MDAFNIIIGIACIIIICTSLWACMSKTVNDGMPLKISLGLTCLSSYLTLAHLSERTLGMLVVSIAAACAASAYQRYIQRIRLFYREGEKRCRHARAA